MCLLIAGSRTRDDRSLIVAANRDELLVRPAEPVQILAEAPRRVGGLDVEGGGTWLAANEHGVVAALTNQPFQHTPGRRSRGELPLLLTQGATAAEGIRMAELRSEDYSPCWMLVGDRESLYYLVVDGEGPPAVTELDPGVYVLENSPLTPISLKAADVLVRAESAFLSTSTTPDLIDILRSHEVPGDPGETVRPPETLAACVHAGPYGTRSAMIVEVGEAPGPPEIFSANGPPCTVPLDPVPELW